MDMQVLAHLMDSSRECEALVHTGHFCAAPTGRISHVMGWTGNSKHRESTVEGDT